MDRCSLDYIACQQGTDKSTRGDLPPALDGYQSRPKQGHGYTIFYEHYLSHLRLEPLRLLEIGVLDGRSLLTWKAYFPNATLYGLDIDPACKQFEDDRTTIFLGSQDDEGVLVQIGETVKDGFDVIIDDGSHYVVHVKTAFNSLFNYVKPGGIYVIEDLHVAASTGWGSFAFNRGMALKREQYGNDPCEMVNFISGLRNRDDVSNLAVHLKKICFIFKVRQSRAEERWPWDRGDRICELFALEEQGRSSILSRFATHMIGHFRQMRTDAKV